MNKEIFRKVSLRLLRSLSWQQRYMADKRINAMLYRMVKAESATTVMLYIPLAMEVDVMPLIRRLRREGILVLVPFMEGESFRLVKYRLPLKTKKYGVKEPKFSKQYRKKMIEFAIVPIVGTDSSLRRIGFGKGMYDRFFARYKKEIGEIVFTQRVLCQSRVSITDDYDVGADRIVTAG